MWRRGVSFGEYAALIGWKARLGKFVDTGKDGDAKVRKCDKRTQKIADGAMRILQTDV